LSKHCEFCGRFFVPDSRVGNRQRACFRSECQDTRKRSSKQAWRARETPGGYFAGRYSYVKEWRKKRRQAMSKVIQDEIPPAKPVVKLVFWLPVTRFSMIQDEITLKRVAGSTFAAPGVSRRMIQDMMAQPP
jgi:hypothetical protein